MRVLLNAVDSYTSNGPFPNFALMKVATYHQDDEVALIGGGLKRQDQMANPDKVYISSIFERTGRAIKGTAAMYGADVVMGGSGINLHTSLPPEIDSLSPNYEIYNDRGVPGWPYAIGFSSRGCGRTCEFCIVSRKEGKLAQSTPIDEIVGSSDKLILLDNNLMMDPQALDKLAWLEDWGGKVNISQGIDARVIARRPDLSQALAEVNYYDRKFTHRNLSLAYDDVKYAKVVEKAVKNLDEADHDLRNQIQFFVLVNWNSTHEEDLKRVVHLRELGTNPFIMIYNKETAPPITIRLARWCNKKALFYSYDTFEDFDNTHKKVLSKGEDDESYINNDDIYRVR